MIQRCRTPASSVTPGSTKLGRKTSSSRARHAATAFRSSFARSSSSPGQMALARAHSYRGWRDNWTMSLFSTKTFCLALGRTATSTAGGCELLSGWLPAAAHFSFWATCGRGTSTTALGAASWSRSTGASWIVPTRPGFSAYEADQSRRTSATRTFDRFSTAHNNSATKYPLARGACGPMGASRTQLPATSERGSRRGSAVSSTLMSPRWQGAASPHSRRSGRLGGRSQRAGSGAQEAPIGVG